MDEKKNTLNEEEIEILETTKEIVTLKDLSIEALDSIETLYQEEFDEHLENAEEEFEKVVTTHENKEEIEKDKKNNFLSNLKKRWNEFPKKKKIYLLVGFGIIFLILCGLIIYFIFFNTKENDSERKEPDVILEADNYRYENGRLIFLDSGQELGSYTCENKKEDLCKVASIKQDEAIDDVRKVLENGEALVTTSKIYSKRFVFVYDNENINENKLLLYDIEEEKVLRNVFDIITSSDYSDYIILKDENSLYGLYKADSLELTSVIPHSYDEIHFLPGQEQLNFVSVRKDNNYYLTNLENKILTKAITSPIVGANNHYIKAKDNLYYVYDYNAKKVSQEAYDYVTLLDDIYFGIKNKSLFVMDYNDNLMSAEGYPLINDLYNTVETYKDSKRIKKESSYSYEKQGNNLSINIYEGDESTNYTLNLDEGYLSSKLAYLQYFSGYLYVYEDIPKTKLIGKYECTNKNNVEHETTTLNSCKPAMDSIFRETRNTRETADYGGGVIPIFGKKYMFIEDGDTIMLYDLKEGKTLAKYESVDTSSYTGAAELTMAMTTNVPFIAKSKSSSLFGVANITSEGVKPLIPFENASILLLGDYYVVEEKKDSYALYNLDGQKVEGFTNKVSPIVDYHKNYLKTIKDDMYYVHGFKEDVSSTAYNYIELYDEYYAAVLNNRVHLYRYDDDLEEKTEYIYDEASEKMGLELITKDYYNHQANAFRITFDSTYIYVEIGNTNGSYGQKMSFLKNKKDVNGESNGGVDTDD